MEQLVQQIEGLKKEIEAYNGGDAETFRIKYLGTKGIVKNIMGEMKNVAVENKKEAGQLLNEFKLFTEAKYAELRSSSANGQKTTINELDLTLPGDPTGSFPSSSDWVLLWLKDPR
jgi:phenylalanyl-tRNA synthetase alpha chain